MTVNSSTTKVSYSGDGNATVFAYTFKIFADADLTVIVRTDATGAESTKTLTTDYTVSGAGNTGGGNVTMVTAPATGETLVIKRSLALTQSTDYVANDPFPAAAHEDALDKLTFIAQQQQEVFDRAVVFPETDTANTTIPDSVTRANKFLGFGASGEVVALSSTGTAPGAIDTNNLVDGAVTTAKIASTAVTTAKITDDAVTQAKIADDAVGSDQIADDAVTVAKININGGELVLDADGDTSITADTDDQIDFKTGGTDRLVIDSSGNVGIGENNPVTPLTLATTNKLGSTFTGTTNGEGLTVTQTDYVAGNFISLVEAAYDDGNLDKPNVRIGAKFDGNGSSLAFGTSNNFTSGITNTAMFIDNVGNVGIGLTNPAVPLHVKGGTNANVMIVDATGTAANYIFDVRDDGTSKFRIDSVGGLRVGTTTQIFNQAEREKMSVKNTGLGHAATFQATNVTGGFPILYVSSTDTSAGQNAIIFQRTGGSVGSITTTASSTAYNTSSDHRLKENVVAMTGAIDRVKALAPKRFNFIADADTTVDGFLAHEAQTVVPEAVTGTHNEVDADGNAVMQGIDQAKLVPLLAGALQEAIAKIETLEARLTALEGA